ncbi:MAG: Sir2 family NAD-dependent protein deacetylase [Terriglobales bacterium]
MIQIGSEDRVFILTGAGTSAESGLPTFRGMNGIWRTYRLEEVASPVAWARDPRLVWEFYSERRRRHHTVQPNPGHYALADWKKSWATASSSARRMLTACTKWRARGA